MLNKEELKIKLEAYAKKIPEAKEYEIVLKSKTEIDIESEFIKNIILDFRMAYHGERYDGASKTLNSCKALAIQLHEYGIFEKLNKIGFGKTTGISIPFLEYFILKSLKPGTQQKKIYRINNKEYSIGQLNDLLLKAKEEIYLLFCEMQSVYNIKENFSWVENVTKNANIGFDDLNLK